MTEGGQVYQLCGPTCDISGEGQNAVRQMVLYTSMAGYSIPLVFGPGHRCMIGSLPGYIWLYDFIPTFQRGPQQGKWSMLYTYQHRGTELVCIVHYPYPSVHAVNRVRVPVHEITEVL